MDLCRETVALAELELLNEQAKRRNRMMPSDREYWIQTLHKIAVPVLENLKNRTLKMNMPIQSNGHHRADCSHLEALGRTLAGIAPWLESGPVDGEEGLLRARMADLARDAIDSATDPKSPDYMNFCNGVQPLVDTAFLAHAIVRAPQELLAKLSPTTRQQLIDAFLSSRVIRPFHNNWLLFSAMIEAALYLMEEPWDRMRVDYAIHQHEQWYVGDGAYKDGHHFHWDYYNSFVIFPMLLDILDTVGNQHEDWTLIREKVLIRAIRYAAIQERSISPEGTYPVIGRSLSYRFGAFQLLAQMSLRDHFPQGVEPAQVRCALTAVMKRSIEAPGTFDSNGWLRIGLCGDQPELGEPYISTGSLYLCTTVFLPLGLPGQHPYWQGQANWTSKKAWSGESTPIDQAIRD